MKKILNIFCGLTLIAGVVSCDDYLDVNQDTNNPALSDLTPDNMISASQTSLATTYSVTMNQLGNIMAATWSGNGQDFADPFGREFRFDITSTFYTGIWENLYARTNNYTHIENYSDGQNWDHHKAVAKILKAFYFQYIVDLYGDSPYTEIHQGVNNLFPAYDNDADTYRNLVTLIDEAIALIQTTDNGTVKDISSTDTMMGGDMAKWTRFANTIKLRLLVRQIDLAQTDAAVNTYITNEFNDMQTEGAQFIGVNDDVTINPGYLNVEGKQNPFFSSYGFDVTGTMRAANRQVGPTALAVDFLSGVTPGSVADPRLAKLWKTRNTGSGPCDETGTAITGITQGQNARPSMLGTALLCNSEQNLPIMLASESFFLQAEAMNRGYMAGGAEAAFDTGIQESFRHLGLTPTDATNYINSITGISGLDINGADPVEAIVRQKWVALTSTNGIEIWIEMTRTGKLQGLALPDDATTPTGLRPIRLLYPDSEYSGNSNNVINQVSDDAFTSKIFWDVN